MSELSTVKVGVPQGTVLGPLLFNIYINELTNLPFRGEIKSYADDTAIVFQGKSWNEVKEIAETELNKIKQTLDELKLTLNKKKNT